MTFQDLLELLRRAIEIALQAVQDGWELSRPHLQEGAQWLADRLAG